MASSSIKKYPAALGKTYDSNSSLAGDDRPSEVVAHGRSVYTWKGEANGSILDRDILRPVSDEINICEKVLTVTTEALDLNEGLATQTTKPAGLVSSQHVSAAQNELKSEAGNEKTEDLLGERNSSVRGFAQPGQMNGGPSLRRGQRNYFDGKMEVLRENDGEKQLKKTKPPDVVVERGRSTQEPAEHIQRNFMPSICPNHDGRNGGEALEAVLYCGNCVQSICYKCAFERHKNHPVSPVPVAAETARITMNDRKRRIESVISRMRTKRKLLETSSDEILQRIHSQFEQTIQRLRKKEDEVVADLSRLRQKRTNVIYGVQNQQEMRWGQIDAVLKTQNDIKMLQEYKELKLIDSKSKDVPADSNLASSKEGNLDFALQTDIPKPFLDLNAVQDEIEKIQLNGLTKTSNAPVSDGGGDEVVGVDELTPRQKKRFQYKLDDNTAHPALKTSAGGTSVELVGPERHHAATSRHNQSLTFPGSYNTTSIYHPRNLRNGMRDGKSKRFSFATILGDSSITQGKQYWEVTVNRSMEYKIGVSYKHMQGTRTLADEHNSWALCLSYPDRFHAVHKNQKDFVFIPSHAASKATKMSRVGVYLDYERGVLGFYNASAAAERRHIYTFRTFFNRPVWPMLSLRQGKLQIVTGLVTPRNLISKAK